MSFRFNFNNLGFWGFGVLGFWGLSPPVYTRPSEYKGWKIPEILLSGNDKKIEEWRHDQAVKRTNERRPDLYNKLSEKDN